MAGRIALITGASDGIGAELARIFAANNHRVALVARRGERLQALADELVAAGAPPPIVIVCDLGAPDAGEIVAAALRAEDVEPDYVVNNAGYGLFGEAAAIPLAAQRDMITVNVAALTELSLRFMDALVRHRGGILNVASVAGFVPGPRMAVYYATKAFVLSFSEALYEEMRGKGVRVTVLCPGPVPTGFQRRAGYRNAFSSEVGTGSREENASFINKERILAKNRFPLFLNSLRGGRPIMSQSAQAVAQAGYRGLMAGKTVVVPNFANRLVTMLVRLLPRRAVVAMMGVVQRRRS